MGRISSRIDSIIKVRNSRVSYIEKAIEDLDKSTAAVGMLEDIQNRCADGSFMAEPEIAERIMSISLKEFYTASKAYRNKLLKLKDRFSRQNLHISLVGRARMGKSLVIQKITGLDGSVIPSSDGSDCTGAKSTITNSDSDTVIAEITFYTEYELVGIINTYLENILGDRSANISSVSQIVSVPIAEIQEKLGYSKVKEGQYLAHLKKYVDNIGDFINNLGKTITVEKEHIEEYVAQYSHSDFNKKYCNFLAVKSANIITKFPHDDVGSVVLLDTIGIGTTSLGVEGSMLDIVENDSDAIVFMFRPDSLGPRVSQDEIDVIDKISKRVGSEYAKEMLFWVINKVVSGKGRNIDYIQGVIDQIEGAKYPVSEILQVNCSDKDEVERELLLPILEKLDRKIEDVDKLILESARADGEKAYSAYNAISSAVDTIFYKCASKNLDLAWGPKFKDMRGSRLSDKLRDLYLKYNALRNDSCGVFKDSCDAVMNRLFSVIPTEDAVMEIIVNAKSQSEVLMICFDRLRLDIIDAFLSLDIDLSTLVKAMKNEVLDIFRCEDGGRLERLVNTDGELSDPDRWIDAFLEKIDAKEDYSIIAGAFEKFRDFECSVKGFLIYEVRDKLDCIDQTIPKPPKPLIPDILNGLDNKKGVAKEIVCLIRYAVEEIHESLGYILGSMVKVPNRAMFAAIKDFYDRAFMESRGSICDANADDQWENLYKSWKHIIWRDEFEQEMSQQNRAKEINGIVDGIKKYNKRDFFVITL